MEFATWLRAWLIRHPLKESSPADRERYTAEVMARVNALPRPSTETARRDVVGHPWAVPRLTWTLGVAAGLALALFSLQGASHRLAKEIDRTSQLLAALDESSLELISPESDEELAESIEATEELLTLAESLPSEDQWLEETLRLLEQLEEDHPLSGVSNDPASEEWLEELELLEEIEPVSAS